VTATIGTLKEAPVYLRLSEQEVLERALKALAEDARLTEPWVATVATELLWAIEDGRTLATIDTRGGGDNDAD